MEKASRRSTAGGPGALDGIVPPLDPGSSAPAVATDGPAVVLAAPGPGPGSCSPVPTTCSRARVAAGVESGPEEGGAGETKGVEKRACGEGHIRGRTRGKRGGTPQVRVPTATGGVEASAINHLDNGISSQNHTPFSGEYISFSEDTHMSSTDSPSQNTLSLSIAIDPPPEYPEPGTMKTQPKLGRNHGRDLDGKVIPHERTDVLAEQVARWVACGAGDNEIAAYLGIRVGQLRKFYKNELETGKFKNDMDVAGTILNLAKLGVPQMSIFWAKARMGWRDTDKNDQNNNALLNIHIHT